VTAFADGEVTIDAIDADRYVEMPKDKDGDLEAILSWLIVPSEAQLHHATAR
jgi:hypothetical protein